MVVAPWKHHTNGFPDVCILQQSYMSIEVVEANPLILNIVRSLGDPDIPRLVLYQCGHMIEEVLGIILSV